MKKVILKIDGMSCSACQNRVEKYLNKQDGVEASVNLVMAQALINYDDEKASIDDLNRFIEEAGYKSLGIYNEKVEEKSDNTKYYLIIYLIVLILLMYISMSHMLSLPVITFLDMINYPINYGISLLILTIPFLIFGFDILKSGIKKIFHLSPNMDSLVSIGVLASFIYSFINLILIFMGNYYLVDSLYFDGTAMIIYFIKLGRFIDNKSKEKTKSAIEDLVQITPEYAILVKDGEEFKVTIDEVEKGDILKCIPGMRVAVDGIITSGEAHLDESFITGEAIPIKKSKGDKLVAGSINYDGVIFYKAEKIGPDSTISQIVKLVVEASNTKAPISRIADKVSGYFVPGIILIAIITFIGYLVLGFSFNEAIISFVTVLVVACPCALGLATPLAIVISEGMSAKNGILIKNSEVLENAYKCDTIVFDKTGTLTYGNLGISKINNYSKYSDNDILEIISTLEDNSDHPISSAFKNYKKLKVENFKSISGIGLSGIINKKQVYVGNNKLFKRLGINNNYIKDEEELTSIGNSIIYVIEEEEVIALIGVGDVIRDNIKGVITKLYNLNKDIIILSGDNKNATEFVAKEVGIEKVISDVLPNEKEKIIKNLISNGCKVMMVGDGINDAPALASSSVGVSINSGTDIALDSSDILIMDDDLSKIVSLLDISSKTIKIIKENLFWAFIYNILMIPIAIGLFKSFGISISPMIAAISMTLSSLCVVFNSLRLRR